MKSAVNLTDLVVDGRMIDHAGIGTYIKNLLFHLQKSELRIQIIIPGQAKEKHPWLSSYTSHTCDAPIYSMEEQIKLPLVIPHCEVFWTPHFNIPLMPIRAKKRLVTIHDLYHLTFPEQFNLLQRFYAKKVIDSAAKQSEKIITGSQFIKREMVQRLKIDPNKVEVVYHGIDHFHLNNSPNSNPQRILPNRYLLFVGNHKPHKNLLRLLKAFRKLISVHPMDLVLVGKKEGFLNGQDIESYLQNDALLAKHVHLLGYVPDQEIAPLYQNAQALILPSIYEGFGLTGLEAQQFGCPVIASNVASLPEIYGESALYIDPFDETDMYHGMLRLLQDHGLRERLKQRAKMHLNQRFLWEHSVKKHVRLINNLCYTDPFY